MGGTYGEIELNRRFQLVEFETEVPDWIKSSASSKEISDIVAGSEAVLKGGQCSYLARIRLVDNVYIQSFVILGDVIAVGLDPAVEYGTHLPIYCATMGIVKHLALQIKGDEVWVYTGKSGLSPFETMEKVRGSDLPAEEVISEEEPFYRFLSDLKIDYDDLDDLDLSNYRSYGIFASVPLKEFAAKIVLLREFLQTNGYFGFIPELIEEHPEPDFRIPVHGFKY